MNVHVFVVSYNPSPYGLIVNATCISLMCNLNPYRFEKNAACILKYNPSPYGFNV